MAKAPAKQEQPVEEAAPPKPKNKLMLIIAIGLVLVLALGGGGTYLLLKKKASLADEDEATSAHKPEAKPIFVKLEAFTVKLMPDEGKLEQQFMQTVPEFKVLDAQVAEKVKAYMPEIRHNILLMLSSRRPSDLSTSEGMEKLSVDIRNVSNQILDGPPSKSSKSSRNDKEPSNGDKPGPDDSVQAVLFSTFIIQ